MKIAEYVYDTERTVTESCTYTLGTVVRGPGDQGQREEWKAVPTEARVALAHQLLATLTDEERDRVAPYATAMRKEALLLSQNLLDEREADKRHKVAFLRQRAEKAEESASQLLQRSEKAEAELSRAHKDSDMLTSRLAVASGIGSDDASIGAIVSLVRDERLLLQSVRQVARDAGWRPPEPLDVWVARLDNALASERLAVETERLAAETERALSDSLKASHNGVHTALLEVIEAAQAEGWEPEDEDLPEWIHRRCADASRAQDEADNYADRLEARLSEVTGSLRAVSAAAYASGWDGLEGLSGWIRRRCCDEEERVPGEYSEVVFGTGVASADPGGRASD